MKEKIIDGFLSFNGESIAFNKKFGEKIMQVLVGMRNFKLLNG